MVGGVKMRIISDDFIIDLKEGMLHPLLNRVKKDDTLMLAIREGYVNIYYRGGNILRLRELNNQNYKAEFDSNYNIVGKTMPNLPDYIKSSEDIQKWIEAIPFLKELMDFYFSAHPKSEREFQQLVARENNKSSISNQSEYFIADIEYADSGNAARFDMLAIRWLATQRKKGEYCKPAFIEMKYSDSALEGESGLLKHLKDLDAFIANKDQYEKVIQTMSEQFQILDSLGLIQFNKGKSNAIVQLDTNDKPEIIFIIANHNPRSKKLKNIINNPRFNEYANSKHFDLRFFVASFAGYGMHADCMLTLEEFSNLLDAR